MDKQKLIILLKEERSRLLKKRPALEKERCQMFSIIDSAQFMPFDIKDKIRMHYNAYLTQIETQISDVEQRIKSLSKG